MQQSKKADIENSTLYTTLKKYIWSETTLYISKIQSRLLAMRSMENLFYDFSQH